MPVGVLPSAVAAGAGQLAGHDAVLFNVSAGSLVGDTFLIVDANGIPGYQAGQDLVFQLDAPAGGIGPGKCPWINDFRRPMDSFGLKARSRVGAGLRLRQTFDRRVPVPAGSALQRR